MGIFSRIFSKTKKGKEKGEDKPRKSDDNDLVDGLDTGKKAKRQNIGRVRDLKKSRPSTRLSSSPSIKAEDRPGKEKRREMKRFDNVGKVLVKPLVTEKTANLGKNNQYGFIVDIEANKVEIKKAIETYYKVKPVKINIINISGKNLRWGRTRGRTKDRKKAIVTLRKGDKIEVYEGV